MFTTIIIFVFLLLALVIAHEAGHFFSARAFGICVEEFGFGLPPRLLSLKGKKTLYSFNALPFGGFVKLRGEEGLDKESLDSFAQKSSFVRSAVLLSGVLANMVLAWVVLSTVLMLGIPEALDETEVAQYPDATISIVEVMQGSSAAKAGLKGGDSIKELRGDVGEVVVLHTIEEVQKFITAHQGKVVSIKAMRDNAEIIISVVPRANPPKGEGPLGVVLSWTHIRHASWYRAPKEGFLLTYDVAKNTIKGFGGALRDVVRGRSEEVAVTGPVGIFSLVKDAKSSGMASLLLFGAVLSVNLALINVLPIPGLDGGRFLFVLLEVFRGKPVSARASALIHGIGLAFLLSLMMLVTYLDLVQLF